MGELSLNVTLGLVVLAGLAPTVLRVLLQVVGLAPHWQGRESARITRFMARIEVAAMLGEAPGLFAGGYLIGLASGRTALTWPLWVAAALAILLAWCGMFVGFRATGERLNYAQHFGTEFTYAAAFMGWRMFWWTLLVQVPVIVGALLLRIV